MPPEWNFCWWSHSPGDDISVVPVDAPIGTSGDIYSGGRAAKIDMVVAPASGYLEFGKRWYSSNPLQYPVGSVLEGTIRVKLSRAALGTNSRLSAYEFNPNAGGSPWHFGTKHQKMLVQTTDWQDVHVRHVIQHAASAAAPHQVRFALEFFGAQNGDSALIDFAVFGPSSSEFNVVDGIPTLPDQEVRSSALSLYVDGATGQLLHLRSTEFSAASGLGTDLINSDATKGLSELFALEGEVVGPYICSANPPDEIQQTATGIVLSHSNAALGIDISAHIDASQSSPDISFTLDVKRLGLTPTILEELTCPVLKLPHQLGSSDGDDRYFVPQGDGQVITPSQLPTTGSLTKEIDYPGEASMQFMSFYDEHDGFVMYAADSQVESKRFITKARRVGALSSMEIRHCIPYTPMAISSYPVVLAPSIGEWTSAASIYREWGLAQDWAKSRPDTLSAPDWLAERPTLFDSVMRPEGIGVPLTTMLDPTAWARVLDEWRTELGCDMLPMHRSFENHGIYATGPLMTPLRVHSTNYVSSTVGYTTLYNEQQIEYSWKNIAGAGHHNAAMVAGLKWAKTRGEFPGPAAPGPICPSATTYWVPELDISNSGWNGSPGNPTGDMVCMKRELPMGPTASQLGGNGWDSLHGVMCPWHPYTKSLHEQFAGYLAQREMDCFQIDQFNSGNLTTCYNDTHGHPMGRGRWVFDEVSSLLDRIQAAGRLENPRFMIAMEHPGEYYMPWVPAFYTRPHRLYPSASQYPMVQVVPAFQFVYSSVSASFIGALDMFTTGALSTDAHRGWPTFQHARSFVAGAMPWVALFHFMLVNDSGLGCGTTSDPLGLLEPLPGRCDPAHLQILKNCVQVGRGPAMEYFNAGKMLPISGGVFPTFLLKWPTAGFGPLVDAPVPEVLHSAWLHADGTKIGIGFVNSRDGAQVSFVPPTAIDGKPIPSAQPATLWVNATLVGTVPWSTLATVVSLGPGDVAWVEIDSY